MSLYPESNKQVNRIPYKTIGYLDTDDIKLSPDTTNVDVAINEAISWFDGAGEVYLGEGVFSISDQIYKRSNIKIKGLNKNSTIIKGGIPYGSTFANVFSGGNPVKVDNFHLEDITIDIDNTSLAGADNLYNDVNSTYKNVRYINGIGSQWFLNLTTKNNLTDGINCTNILIEDCEFDNHDSPKEMIDLLNCQDIHIIRPVFTRKLSGPCIGLWQKCNNVYIENPIFRDFAGTCIYYNTTGQNLTIRDLYAENTGTILYGSGVPDSYTDSGLDPVWLKPFENLKVDGFTAIGGTNSLSATAIELGAVNGFDIKVNKIKGYCNSVVFSKGKGAVSALATNGNVTINEVQNSNPNNTHSILNPAILFKDIGGEMNLNITNINFSDNQTTPTQQYPVVFYGSHTWSNIKIRDCNLKPYNSRQSVTTVDGATLDSASVKFIDCTNTTKGTLSSYYKEI